MLDGLDDVFASAGKVLGGALVVILAWLVSKAETFAHSKRVRVQKDAFNRNARIRDMLLESLARLEADRVLLFQFSNGEYFVSGGSQQKVSVTHCVKARGIEYPYGLMNELQNIPASYLISGLELLVKGQVIASRVEELPEDYYTKRLLLANGDESVMFFPLLCKSTGLLGMVCVTWMADHRFHEEDEAEGRALARLLSAEVQWDGKTRTEVK